MIPSTPRRSPVYTGNGVVSSFAFEFKVFAASDVEVSRVDLLGNTTVLTLGSDYTVTLNPDQDSFPGGTVNTTAPLTAGFKLVATGKLPYQQSTQLPNGGNYNARVVEQALDKIVVQVQQLKEASDRTLRLSVGVDGASSALPAPLPLSVIGWDSTGLLLRNFTPGDIGVNVSYAQWQTQLFNGTGAQTTFVLTEDAGSVNNIDLRVNNVPQTPGVNFTYTQSTRTITFLTGAPAAGTNNVVARYGQALPQGAFSLADGSVTSAKLADKAVTLAKVQDVATASFLGRAAAGAGAPEVLSAAQAQALMPVQQARVDVASAATVVVPTTTDHINITGTTGITLVTLAAGRTIFVRFAGVLTLTNNANIVTQSGANIVTAAGDTCILRATAANVVEVLAYTRGIPQALGDGQAWQVVTGSRALGTTYTNTTGRTIFVSVAITGSTVTQANYLVAVGGVTVIDTLLGTPGNADNSTFYFPVPAGLTYSISVLSGPGVLRSWSELR